MFPAELPVLRDVAIVGTVARQLSLGPGFCLRPPSLAALPAPQAGTVSPESAPTNPDPLAVQVAAHVDAAWPALRAELIAQICQQLHAPAPPLAEEARDEQA